MELTGAARRLAALRVPLAVSLGVVLLLASLLIAGLALRTHAGDRTSRGAAAPPGDDSRWVALGHVDAEAGVTPLYPLQYGRVRSIEARENEAVQAGAPLLHLDDTLAALQVEEAQTALAATRDRLAQAEEMARQYREKVAAQKQAVEAARCDAELARIQRDRVKRLNREGVSGNPEDVQSAEVVVEKAAAGLQGEEKKLAALEALDPDVGIRLAKRDVDAKQLLLRKAQKARDEHTLRAPFAGTPLRILAGVGESLGPNPRQAAIQFCPAGPLVVRADVDQEFAGRVRERQAVRVLDHITGKEIGPGRVERIAGWYAHRRSIIQEPLQFSDVRTLECLVKLDPGTYSIRVGQRVRVEFQPGDR
jgi:multidrug resistance efflux pump